MNEPTNNNNNIESSVTTLSSLAETIHKYNNDHAVYNLQQTTIQPLPDFLEVDISDLTFYERCGNGAYGAVYRAHWISRDKEVAVKKLLQLDNEVKYFCFISI